MGEAHADGLLHSLCEWNLPLFPDLSGISEARVSLTVSDTLRVVQTVV